MRENFRNFHIVGFSHSCNIFFFSSTVKITYYLGFRNYVEYGSLLDLQLMRALSSEALSGAFMSSLLGIIGVSVNLKMSSFSANLKKKKVKIVPCSCTVKGQQ